MGFIIPPVAADTPMQAIVEAFPYWTLDRVYLSCGESPHFCVVSDETRDKIIVVVLNEGDKIFPDGTIIKDE